MFCLSEFQDEFSTKLFTQESLVIFSLEFRELKICNGIYLVLFKKMVFRLYAPSDDNPSSDFM